jgi:hypothetical protein
MLGEGEERSMGRLTRELEALRERGPSSVPSALLLLRSVLPRRVLMALPPSSYTSMTRISSLSDTPSHGCHQD